MAIAHGDAATAVSSVDRRPASILAGQLRADLSRQLTSVFDSNQEAGAMLRDIGAALANHVKGRRLGRIKAAQDRKMAAINRKLLARMKAEDETPEALVERFNSEYNVELGWEPSLGDRILQREDAARKEAIDQGRELDD